MDNKPNLDAARAKFKEMKVAGLSFERLDPIEKARRDPKSKAKAIAAKCWCCVGCGHDPNPREMIRFCEAKSCPLHPVRPYQCKTESDVDQ